MKIQGGVRKFLKVVFAQSLATNEKRFFSACLFSQYITTQLFFFVSIVVSQCYLKIISEQKDSNVHWESSLSFLVSKCSLTIIHNISF